MQKGKPHITTYNSPIPSEELYRFGADGNLRMYSYDRLFYSLYGYDGGTTRTYKYSFDLTPNWVNGQLLDVNFNPHNAMFYPNSYLNFNQDGYYTKHYYNGMERIASRLGDRNLQIHTHDPELQDRKDWQDSLIRKNVIEITGYEFLPVGEEQNHEDPKPVFELPQVGMNGLHPIGSGSVYYYHSNHLGSTCYVTDENASVVQGFLYAPFGEITNEYNSSFGSSVLPKYSFNAKELDEETGMYYYEARYYQPPVFISRDVLFEGKPNMSPYAYCVNNPIKFIDPDGRDTLFSFACNTKDKVKNEKNKRILKWLRRVGDNKSLYSISMHGSPTTMAMNNSNMGTETNPITATELAGRIKKMPNIYTDNLDKGLPTIFILYSCETGYGNNSFGEQLSKNLEKSIVFAPEGMIWTHLNEDGKPVIDNAEGIPTGNEKNPYRKGKHCQWNIFYNGKKVMSFNHAAPQAWIKKQGGINKVIKKIMQQQNEYNK